MSELRIRRSRQPTVAARAEVHARTSMIGSVKRADTSRQLVTDNEFASDAISGTIIAPPYDPRFLYYCIERSNMLKQCIAAMVTNIALCGFDIVSTTADGKINKAEEEELRSFLDAPNAEESLVSVHAKVVDDYESMGYAFLEVIRDRAGRVSLLRHSPAMRTRLLPKDNKPQPVTYEILRGRRVSKVTEYRTFRRYAQVHRGKVRYFKEFGDTRTLNMDTGEFGPCPEHLQATEIKHIRQNSDDAYGVPRWINQLPSILGSREAEECNLKYFEDNTIPPMILTVAGGRLTRQSYQDLQNVLTGGGLGAERQHKMMLIEAVPEKEGLDDKGTVSLKIDKLTDARQSDGLFKEYDEGNQAKVRSSFRLPPVAVGLSQDVTFATANVSAFIAESQVYLPQRNIFDELYNRNLVNTDLGLGLKTCKLQSRVPLTSNSETIVKSMTAINTMGGMTPRMANEMGNQLLQINIPAYPEKGTEGWEEWMDKPILFVTRGTASQDGQAQKTEEVKKVEETGDVSKQQPENGQQ